jgi:hypothetical protein
MADRRPDERKPGSQAAEIHGGPEYVSRPSDARWVHESALHLL